MTSQTRARVGLLLGLMFIIAFGIILSEFRPVEASRKSLPDAAVIDEGPRGQGPEFVPAAFDYTPPPPRRIARPPHEENKGYRVVVEEPEKRERTRFTRAIMLKMEETVPPPVPGITRSSNVAAVEKQPPDEPDFSLTPVVDPVKPKVREVTIGQLPRIIASGARNPKPKPAVRQKFYVVRSGDNLTSIARKTLGDGSSNAVDKLFNANRDRLRNKHNITVGTKLRIPG